MATKTVGTGVGQGLLLIGIGVIILYFAWTKKTPLLPGIQS